MRKFKDRLIEGLASEEAIEARRTQGQIETTLYLVVIGGFLFGALIYGLLNFFLGQ